MFFLQYDIQPLKSVCATSLGVDVTVDVAAKNFYYAHQHGLDCMGTIAKFIADNKTAVMATYGWKKFFLPNVNLVVALYELS